MLLLNFVEYLILKDSNRPLVLIVGRILYAAGVVEVQRQRTRPILLRAYHYKVVALMRLINKSGGRICNALRSTVFQLDLITKRRAVVSWLDLGLD